MALTWTLTLKDKVTPGAKSASASLAGVESALKRVQRSANLTEKGWRGSVSRMTQNVIGGVKQLGSKMSSAFASLGDVLPGPGMFAAAGAAALGGAVLGVKAIRDAQAFKAATMGAFELILKSKSGARDAFDLAAKTSLDMGADFRSSMASFNALLAQGFDPKSADQLMRAMSDLTRINPGANLEGIVRAISQIKTTGRLQGDELMQLAEAGVNVGDVYKQIAKDLGLVDKAGMTATQQVQQLQAQGKVSSETAIKGIMASIKGQLGGREFGSISMEATNKSLEGTIARILNLKDQMMASIDVDWSPLKSAVDAVFEAMQSPAAKQMLDAIGSSLSRIIKTIFGGVKKGQVESVFLGIAKAVRQFADVVDAAAETVRTLQSAWQAIAGPLSQAQSQFAMLGPVAQVLGSALSTVVNPLTALQQAFTAVSAYVQSAMVAFQNIGPMFTTLGGSIIQGIVAGIKAGGSAVVTAITEVAKSALDAAKEELGIASPSKEFAKLGRHGSRGLAMGLAGGAPEAAGAASSMAGSALAAGQRIASAITNNSTNNSRSATIGTVNNYGGGDGGGDFAEELRRMVFAHG